MQQFKEFLDRQGRNLQDLPNWKLVWSEDAMELRKGEFSEFLGSVFLRTVRDVRWVRKYSYIKDRWILERWFPPEICYTDELPNSVQGSYEPVFVYEDKNGLALPVTIKSLEHIIGAANRPRKVSAEQRELEIMNELTKAEDQEVKDFEDSIDASPIASLLHTKEGIIVP
jgi:hypothetical protein